MRRPLTLHPPPPQWRSVTPVCWCVWQWHQYFGVCGKAPPKYLKPRVGTDGEGRREEGQQYRANSIHALPPHPRPSVRHRCQAKNADVK